MTNYENCPNCNNVGWYAVHGHDGEPEQEQCEFCYTTENSIFNVIAKLEQQLATVKQEATAYRISLENLEASLPKVRADAVREAASIVSSGAIEINHRFMIIEQPYCYISTRALHEHADKLEAGNE